jgi:hypothetical protein
MTYQEAMIGYRSLGYGFPKKGQLFVAHKNHGGHCQILKCFQTFKKIGAEIVEKIDNSK